MKKKVEFEDLVQDGVRRILLSFGKGEDLRGAVWGIVNGACLWSREETEERIAREARADKRRKAPKTRRGGKRVTK